MSALSALRLLHPDGRTLIVSFCTSALGPIDDIAVTSQSNPPRTGKVPGCLGLNEFHADLGEVATWDWEAFVATQGATERDGDDDAIVRLRLVAITAGRARAGNACVLRQ
jgi:hypothetical protein